MGTRVIDRAQCLAMVKAGRTAMDIALAFKVKRPAVYRALKKLNVETDGMARYRLKMGKTPPAERLLPPAVKESREAPPPPINVLPPLRQSFPCGRCGAKPGACGHGAAKIGWSVG